MKKLIIFTLSTFLLGACSTHDSQFKYVYEECFDNETADFAFIRQAFKEELMEANLLYENCDVMYRGSQDIIGCTGDFYYKFRCF